MKKLLLSAYIMFLCACASSTQYMQASNENDYGYSESRLTDNRYRVNFKGNTNTSSNEVKDMALLRAAEVTLLNDYDWFRVVTQETEQSTIATPQASTIGGAQQVFRDCGPLGCTTTVTPAYTGVEVITIMEEDRYTTSIEIVMGNGNLEDETTAYDASELRNSLASRY